MSVFPRVVVDESHSEAWSLDLQAAALINPAQPADASYAQAAETLRHRGYEVVPHTEGEIDEGVLRDADVLVVAHPADSGSERTSGSGSTVFTPAELDTSLPKNFPKPLTCHFWHQNGRCSKRDVDCAYAHYDTGFISSAPVTPLGGVHKLTQTPIKQHLTKQNNSFRSLRWQEHRQVRQETRHAHAIAGRSTEAGEYCGWR